jgi:hypothetical protein
MESHGNFCLCSVNTTKFANVLEKRQMSVNLVIDSKLCVRCVLFLQQIEVEFKNLWNKKLSFLNMYMKISCPHVALNHEI